MFSSNWCLMRSNACTLQNARIKTTPTSVHWLWSTRSVTVVTSTGCAVSHVEMLSKHLRVCPATARTENWLRPTQPDSIWFIQSYLAVVQQLFDCVRVEVPINSHLFFKTIVLCVNSSKDFLVLVYVVFSDNN